jgi:hypothetical protein
MPYHHGMRVRLKQQVDPCMTFEGGATVQLTQSLHVPITNRNEQKVTLEAVSGTVKRKSPSSVYARPAQQRCVSGNTV